MSKRQNKSNPEYKQKTRLFCCSCFGKKKHSSTSSTIDCSNKNEPYDYVVEKLAIKRVPISLFVSKEDLEICSKKTILTNSSLTTQESDKSVKSVQPVKEKPSVSFSAYYKYSPKSDIEHISYTNIPRHQSSDTELDYESETEIRYHTDYEKRSHRKMLTEQQEKQLVADILNKHSSLFTLDTKQAIPKDPDHRPRSRVVIPPSVHGALRDIPHQNFPPLQNIRQTQVEVHTISNLEKPVYIPPMKYPTSMSQSGKKLTPELKETINALGIAQKPRLPNCPPKNQRNLLAIMRDESTEQHIFCNVLAGDEVTEKIPSREMNCYLLDPKSKGDSSKNSSRKKRCSIEESSYADTECDSYSEGTISYENQSSRNIVRQQNNADLNNKAVMAVPSCRDTHIQHLPVHEGVNTSQPQVQDSEQITEFDQMKGQSLKWKIIIKHHSDKKKESRAIVEKSNDSDTDGDSKQYFLNRKSSSPHR